MKFQNRFIRLAAAFAIIGVVATQIPTKSSVALAADGYGDSGGGFFSLKGGGGIALGAILVGAGYSALVNAGKAAGAAVGSVGAIGVGNKPIYDVIDSDPADYSIIASLIRSSEQVENYRKNGQYTVLAPTDSALIRELGQSTIDSLQTTAKQAEAKKLLFSITVKGSYNIAALKDAARSGKILDTLSGQSVSLRMDGDKLTANGVEVLNNEAPASNGWVIATNGLVNKEDQSSL